MDRDTKVIARLVSPGYDAVEKFANGRKEGFGPGAGNLSRSVKRFVDSVHKAIERVAPGGLSRQDMSDEVADALDVAASGSGGANPIHVSFVTDDVVLSIPERVAAMASSKLAGGMDRLRGVMAAVEHASPIALRTWKQDTLESIGVAAWMASKLAFKAGASLQKLSDDMMVKTYGEFIEVGRPVDPPFPIEVKPLDFGRFSPPAKSPWTFPSREFRDAATMVLTRTMGQQDLAKSQMVRTLSTFLDHGANRERCVVESMGLRFDGRDGTCSIGVPDRDQPSGYRAIAYEANGKITVVDPTFYAFSGAAEEDALLPFPS